MKVIKFFIEAVFWMAAFLSPVLGFAVIAVLVYMYDDRLFSLAVFILVIGAISGVVFAEWVRCTHGCSNYFGRLLSTPDIDTKKDS